MHAFPCDESDLALCPQKSQICKGLVVHLHYMVMSAFCMFKSYLRTFQWFSLEQFAPNV